MFDLNAIPESIAFAKICCNLQERHEQFVKDLTNVEKDEQIVGLRRVIIEKDEMINTLKKGLLAVEKNQEFARKAQGMTHNDRNNLYEDKNGKQFCTKCFYERKEFIPVARYDSNYPDKKYCCVCKEIYSDVEEKEKRRKQQSIKANHYRPNLGNFSR